MKLTQASAEVGVISWRNCPTNGIFVNMLTSIKSHSAMNSAESKSTKRLVATGTGSMCCTCHKMKLSGSISDLQKGEQCVHSQYLFHS
ncbi:hypothetical protein J3R82DRAFT_9100 [Butyriboletus roseoflavus]|nr:hypothetical protein J3R82DRAFT_9100 [Butyriboletus roseoflavus]